MVRNITLAMCGAMFGSACATANYNAMETAEVYAATYCPEVPFTALSYCVRSRFDTVYPRWRSDANADLVNIFLAWSDAAASHVADGTLNEAEARQRADALEARLDQILAERRRNAQLKAQINSQIAAQMMLAGFALIAAGQTQPVMPPQPAPNRQPIAPAVVPFPSTPLVTTPQYRPLSVPRPIVCSVTGDAQLATVLCH